MRYKVTDPDQEVNLTDFKKQCQIKGTTVTTASLAILGQTMKQWFREHGEPFTDEIKFTAPFALLPPPRDMSEVRTGNFFTPVLYRLALEDDLDKAIKKQKVHAKEFSILDALGF